MNRRQFAIGGIISLAAPFLAGCPTSPDLQQQLEGLLTQVGAALDKLMPILRSWNAKVANDIEDGFNLLVSAVNGYKPGNQVQSIEAAVNALVTALQAIVQYIPQAGPYLAMVQLVVATVEGILALVLPTTSMSPNSKFSPVSFRRVGKHVYIDIENAQSVMDPPSTGPEFTTAWDKLAPAELKI